MMRYRDITTEAPDYTPLPFYSSDTGTDMDLADWLADTSAATAPAEAGLGEGGFLAPTPSGDGEQELSGDGDAEFLGGGADLEASARAAPPLAEAGPEALEPTDAAAATEEATPEPSTPEVDTAESEPSPEPASTEQSSSPPDLGSDAAAGD
jgi:hypothetical protein